MKLPVCSKTFVIIQKGAFATRKHLFVYDSYDISIGLCSVRLTAYFEDTYSG